jgi:hypothetical protein
MLRTSTGRAFSTDVQLQCRVFWGQEGKLEFSATAVTIDPGSVALRFPGNGIPYPDVGERVELEVSLPVNPNSAGGKCLTCRAEVVSVTEIEDGSRQLDLIFRRAAFRDLLPGSRPKAPRALKKAAVQ